MPFSTTGSEVQFIVNFLHFLSGVSLGLKLLVVAFYAEILLFCIEFVLLLLFVVLP